MATVLWANLSHGQTIAFNPNTDVLEFSASFSANLLRLTALGATSTRFTLDGKSVNVNGMGIDQIVSSQFPAGDENVSFPFGRIIVGDNLVTQGADNASNEIEGSGSDDHLLGRGGDDTISGSFGDDYVDGGAGNDVMDGGHPLLPSPNQVDTLSYLSASAGVTVSLAITTQQNTGGSGLDTVRNFHNLIGGAFADHLTGNSGDNEITGGAGNDTLVGADGEDLLMGDAGTDTILGGGGADLLIGGAGNDTMNGGSGNDTLDYSHAPAGVSVNLTTGTASGGAGADTISNFETVIGSIHNDALTGNALANELTGDSGNDTLLGEGGADLLFGDAGNDTLRGGAGNDSLEGATGNDVLDGGTGVDSVSYDYDWVLGPISVNLNILAAQNIGAAGNDTLASIENVTSWIFNDTLTGNGAGNLLDGHLGRDTLTGNGGNDYLRGGFVDRGVGGTPIYSTDGDTMTGGAGNDTYEVSISATQAGNFAVLSTFTAGLATADLVIEAANGGTDTVNAFVNYALPAHVENLQLMGPHDLNGTGNTLVNSLTGNSGNNVLTAGAGNDTLSGEGGNDILRGQAGADTLVGGLGADRFDFDLVTDSGLTDATRDTVSDFVRAHADRIDISGLDANLGVAGNQAFQFIGGAAFTGNATGKLRFEAATHLILGSNDADITAEFSILVTGVASMIAADFVL